MAGAVFALTCGRARRLVAKVRIIPESNEGRSRGQGQGKASLIQKMRNSRRSAEITQLLESIQPNMVKEYNMGISAYGRARDWKRALALLAKMRKSGVSPNVISFNAAISACEKGGQWERALSLLDEMRESGVSPNVISFNAAILL